MAGRHRGHPEDRRRVKKARAALGRALDLIRQAYADLRDDVISIDPPDARYIADLTARIVTACGSMIRALTYTGECAPDLGGTHSPVFTELIVSRGASRWHCMCAKCGKFITLQPGDVAIVGPVTPLSDTQPDIPCVT